MIHVAGMSRTLSLYIARRFLGGFGLVLLALGAIIFLIDILEFLRRGSGKPEITFPLIIELAILKLPHTMERIVPFAALFGGMFAFWKLTRSSELIVARASGVSVWQFLLPAIAVSVLVGMFAIAAFNPFSATLLLRYERLESEYFKGQDELLSISESGLWLRQGGTQQESVIHALRMAPADMVLKEVTVFLYDSEHRFAGRLDADEATLEDGTWRITNVLVTGPDRPSRKEADYRLPTDWTPEKIQDSFAPPETLSFWRLPSFIGLLEQAGFAATRHRVHWYSLFATPIMLAAMVLIAASFSLRMARRGGAALLLTAGVLFSFFVFFLSDVVVALGLSATIPPALAAWTPATTTTLIGLTILLHIEDG